MLVADETAREVSMKKSILIVLVLALILSIGLPQRAHANSYYYNNWWVPGAAFFGGALFGAAISRPYPYPYPYYYYPPAPVYAYPAPVYAYPQPVYAYPPQQPQGYVYQSPASPYAQAPQAQTQQSTPGEWVTVPGQWVGDKYVQSHQMWVPAK